MSSRKAKARKLANLAPAAAPQPILYKVLVDGASCHGGALTWSLPKDGQPGEWHRVEDKIRKCNTGIHLTTDPVQWWKAGCTVYLAEAEGLVGEVDDEAKIVCRGARLIRELTDDELAALRIFRHGTHEAREGRFVASGSSTVTASGSSTVTAYDSSTVRAYDSSTVRAYDSSTVTASGSSTVTAYGSSTVRAYDSSTVTASGSSTVTAYDSSTVRASGSSTVRASYAVTVITHYGQARVELHECAVHVDHRHSPPVVNRAPEPETAAPPPADPDRETSSSPGAGVLGAEPPPEAP